MIFGHIVSNHLRFIMASQLITINEKKKPRPFESEPIRDNWKSEWFRCSMDRQPSKTTQQSSTTRIETWQPEQPKMFFPNFCILFCVVTSSWNCTLFCLFQSSGHAIQCRLVWNLTKSTRTNNNNNKKKTVECFDCRL